ARAGEGVWVVEQPASLPDQISQLRQFFCCGVPRRELRGEAFDRALRGHDLLAIDVGELELHRQGFGEKLRVAMRDARAATRAARDRHYSETLQGAQRVTGGHPAYAMARCQVLLGAEEVARPVPPLEQRLTHAGNDARRERLRPASKEGMDRHVVK